MNIGIVGAGVGFPSADSFASRRADIRLLQPQFRQRKRSCRIYKFGHYTDLGKLIEVSDAIFITVPDNAITEVYRQQVAEFEIQDKYICHCSGGPYSRGSPVFTRREPMQYPFICYFRSAASITAGGAGRCFFVEGDTQAVEVCAAAADWGYGCRPFHRSKAQYHLSCALAR